MIHLLDLPLLACVLPLAFVSGPVAGPVAGTGDAVAGGADGSTISAEVDSLPNGLHIERQLGDLALVIPEGERLEFRVTIGLGVLGDPSVGRFVLSAGSEEYFAGLPLAGTPAAKVTEAGTRAPRTGWIKGKADGSALGYVLDHTIEARHLPQEFPSLVYRDVQAGTENRRREVKVGVQEGARALVYRSDTHCLGCERREHYVEGTWPFGDDHHCRKCKRGEHRDWRAPKQRSVPDDAVDMLSAIHLARAMIRTGQQTAAFPLIDKDRIWNLSLYRGELAEIETKAGTFRCRSVKMSPTVPPGEQQDAKFKGLFGIHGSLNIWLEHETGVPVLLEGVVPLGIDLDVRLELAAFEGTPDGFRTLDARR